MCVASRLEATDSAEVIGKTLQEEPVKPKYYVTDIDPCVGIPVAKEEIPPARNPFSRVEKQTGRIMQAASLWDTADKMPLESGNPLKMYLLSKTDIWNENN